MKILITGGAGFIGSNLTKHGLKQGHDIIVLDNLSRPNVDKNLNWLKEDSPENLTFIKADTKDYDWQNLDLKSFDGIFHLAAQVAVTTSVDEPMEDFLVNAYATVRLLDAMRKQGSKALIVYSSTNKVYGNLEDIELEESETKYSFLNEKYKNGVDENRKLDFHSPYGCSKGAADLYVHDFSRIYDLNTVVLRKSCIYGERQFGTEDQGWIFHFVNRIINGQHLNIFGDGKQVRDILYIGDLVKLYYSLLENKNQVSGEIFNIGGGVQNSISLIEAMDMIHDQTGKEVKIKTFIERPGDQKIYISDSTKVRSLIGWKSKTTVSDGVAKLISWAKEIKNI